MNINTGLIVGGGGEYLFLTGRDSCVPFYEPRHNPAHRLNTQRKRCNIQQQNILNSRISRQYRALNSRTERDYLVRINTPVRFLAENILCYFLNLRDSRGTANQQYLGNIRVWNFGIFNRFSAWALEPFEYCLRQSLEFASCYSDLQMFRPGRVGCDERKIDR